MSNPPPLSSPPLPPSVDPRSLHVLAGALGLTVLLDFLLWSPHLGGAAVAVAIALLGAAFTVGARFHPPRLTLYLALAAASAVQALIELKPSTVAVSLVLLLGMVGEGHFAHLTTLAARWLEALPAALFPFPGLLRLKALCPDPAELRAGAGRRIAKVWRAGQIALPALLLAGVFAGFFAQGNAVFRQLVGDAIGHAWDWLTGIDLSPTRFLFWIAVFILLVSLLRPLRNGFGTWAAQRRLPRWERADASLGWWQSVSVLGVLNVLFCYVNTLDVVYLWEKAKLPVGVNRSEFLHEGVQSLTIAVLLSAVILVALFQQKLAVGSRALQVLATAWVVQNLVVISGVCKRVALYVGDYDLSLLRVGVLLFLALVIAGYVLLAVYFWSGKGLGWLLRANVLATFGLFFVVQFIDLDAAVAQYNVDRWLRPGAKLGDVAYLASLGHGGWPAMIQLSRARRGVEMVGLVDHAAEEANAELAVHDWRRWELRRRQHAQEMADYQKQRVERL
ncbi:MAG TPA: DUF4173 domain-containing protein [Chthoniobacteraceae bacterium]|jgi:hypothetical protein|nr:DUF4173 domain-containing protein [Chthoniobacteraceae bacterium]